MNTFDDLKELLQDELKKIVRKGDITPHELENVYKAIDVIKDIEQISTMQEEGGSSQDGYSQDGGYSQRRGVRRYSRDNSNDYSGARGRYSREGNSNEYSGEYSREGNSNDGGMSNNYGGNSRDGGGSYNNSNDYSSDNSYARQNRDSRGRYSRDGGNSYEESRWGYSRNAEKDKMIQKLEQMLQEASTQREKDTIMRCIDKLEE